MITEPISRSSLGEWIIRMISRSPWETCLIMPLGWQVLICFVGGSHRKSLVGRHHHRLSSVDLWGTAGSPPKHDPGQDLQPCSYNLCYRMLLVQALMLTKPHETLGPVYADGLFSQQEIHYGWVLQQIPETPHISPLRCCKWRRLSDSLS